MKQRHSMTAFFLEALLLIGIFISIILLLTRIFAASRLESDEAYELTRAVCLASNAAEEAADARDASELCERLNAQNNAALDDDTITAAYAYDLTPQADGPLRVSIAWEPEDEAADTLVHCTVTVTRSADGAQLYQLETAVYVEEDAS